MDIKIRNRDNLIKEQKHLIELFDKWVSLVKVDDLEGAKEVKDLANIVRGHIKELEKIIVDENKSKIILLNNKLN
jgi:hypothetical protein